MFEFGNSAVLFWASFKSKLLLYQRVNDFSTYFFGVAVYLCGMSCSVFCNAMEDMYVYMLSTEYHPVVKHGVLENGPLISEFPIKTSICNGFSSQPCLITRG